jgi:hypothetical protein
MGKMLLLRLLLLAHVSRYQVLGAASSVLQRSLARYCLPQALSAGRTESA